MRKAKIPMEKVIDSVLASLWRRRDPETHLVQPRWALLMREADVCRQRIAIALKILEGEGVVKRHWVPIPGSTRNEGNLYYEVLREHRQETANEATPAPAEATPAPADETPAPAEETPAPAEATPAPAEATPAPAENA